MALPTAPAAADANLSLRDSKTLVLKKLTFSGVCELRRPEWICQLNKISESNVEFSRKICMMYRRCNPELGTF